MTHHREPRSAAIETEHHRIPVLYEDEELIALDKPVGLASIPERNPARVSLFSLLTAAAGRRFFVVHRLDKEVSGVILFAKTAAAHRALNLLFEARRVRKTYFALVHGAVAADSGTIEIPLRRFGSGRMGPDPAAGKPCSTGYRVVRRSAAFTRLEVYPITGRKHQIRAHLFAVGNPVVGDRLYGDRLLQRAFPRTMLHAARIEFDWAGGGRLAVESSSADGFLSLADRLMDSPAGSAV